MGTIIFNTEHYGALFNLICLRMLRHREDCAILVVKDTGREDKVNLHKNLLKNRVFDKIIKHDGRIGTREVSEMGVKSTLCTYFQHLFDAENVNLSSISKFYVSHDCDNNFATFLSLMDFQYTIVELAPKQFDSLECYNTSYKKGRTSEAYSILQKKYSVLCGEKNKHIRIRAEASDSEDYFLASSQCQHLSDSDRICVLKSLFPNRDSLHDGCCQLFLSNSKQFDRFIPYPQKYKQYCYTQILDYFTKYNQPLVVKPHPESSDMFKDILPDDILIDGNFPIDVIKLDSDANIYSVITVDSNAIRYVEEGIAENGIRLGRDFFRKSLYLHKFMVAFKIAIANGLRIEQNIISKDAFDYLLSLYLNDNADYSRDKCCYIFETFEELDAHIQKAECSVAFVVNDLFQMKYKLCQKHIPHTHTISIHVSRTCQNSIAIEGTYNLFMYSRDDTIDITNLSGEYLLKYSLCKVQYLSTFVPTVQLDNYISNTQNIGESLKRSIKKGDVDQINSLLNIDETCWDGDAYFHFATLYYKGIVVTKNLNRTICYLRMAHHLLNSDAWDVLIKRLFERHYLEDFCEIDMLLGFAKTPIMKRKLCAELLSCKFNKQYDLDRAIELYKENVMEGDESSVLPLVNLLQFRNKYNDDSMAFDLLKRFARSINTSGTYYTLSKYYLKPDDDNYNLNLAIEYMKLSADKGYWRAKGELISLLVKRAKPEDIRFAYDYASKLDAEGDVSGTYNLAIMYRDGIGVEKSATKYHDFIRKAAEGGHKKSINILQKI